jgi:hypothetical protein
MTLAGEAAISGNEGNREFGLQEQSPGVLKLTLENGFAGRSAGGCLVVPVEVPL